MKLLYLAFCISLPAVFFGQEVAQKKKTDTLTYVASYELTKANLEEQLFYHLPANRTNYTNTLRTKITGFNATDANNMQLCKIDKKGKLGTAILLQVDSADSFECTVEAFQENLKAANKPKSRKENNIATILSSLFWKHDIDIESQVIKSKAKFNVTNLINMVEQTKETSTNASGSINYILFDAKLQFVNTKNNMGFEKIKEKGKQEILNPKINVQQKGYLLVYLSNDAELPVYFDNLKIKHIKPSANARTTSSGFIITESGVNITTENSINLITEN